MAKVVIYCTLTCPFCLRALELLDQKAVAYEKIYVDGRPDLRREMQIRSGGCHSVPQIFINEYHVGGCNELYALEQTGKLDDWLQLPAGRLQK